MSVCCNQTPPCCVYYGGCAQITADESLNNAEEDDDAVSRPLREKNCRKNGKYPHVPHRDKPPQVVARRNARERRRVQAVNGAFMRLRKAVPSENNRGKRISKVKTLQNAIHYIENLQELLRRDGCYEPLNPDYCYVAQSIFYDRSDYHEEELEGEFYY